MSLEISWAGKTEADCWNVYPPIENIILHSRKTTIRLKVGWL